MKGMERSTLWLMSIIPKWWIYQLEPTNLHLRNILWHHWETFTLFTLTWRRWQSNADPVEVEIKTTKECDTSVGEDKACKWKVNHKNPQKSPEKTHQSSRNLRHSDEVVSQARLITKTSIYFKAFTYSCNRLAEKDDGFLSSFMKKCIFCGI